MRAFWWFRQGQVAGMARPGFNKKNWFDLSFEHASLLGWLGRHSCGEVEVKTFNDHMDYFIPRVCKFYDMEIQEGFTLMEPYRTPMGVTEGLEKLNEQTHLIDSFHVDNGTLHFKYCRNRLDEEVSYFKKQGIKVIVALTEKHHHKDYLAGHFETHHLPVDDLHSPSPEQIEHVAELITRAKNNRHALGIHCLAGIGRTSTTLIAAHLLLGEKFEQLKEQMAKCNPSFRLTGNQNEFIQNIQGKKQ